MTIEAHQDPCDLFDSWWQDARNAGMKYPNAVSLATVDAEGMPAVRMVLVKGVEPRGFVFYTNLESVKATHLAANPRAALCYYWDILGRQVRVRGPVESVTDEEADAYFATRPRISQIGAWASAQSRPLESREALLARVKTLESEYDGRDVPRPPHWSGYRVLPVQIEFWQEGEYRLHDRVQYNRTDGGEWTCRFLNP
ncbi:MAG: pyridoxamine 5-phosphate oxidase [Candidatus Sumerlaeota bacterium]|nr:pyridoxamine 5-phosphate oxidase [Candidatus Sumerlaeota bacterium]